MDRDAFGADLLVTLNGQHTVQEFKAARAVSLLRSLAEFGVDPDPTVADRVASWSRTPGVAKSAKRPDQRDADMGVT